MKKKYGLGIVCGLLFIILVIGCQKLELQSNNDTVSSHTNTNIDKPVLNSNKKEKIIVGLSIDQEFESRVNVTNAIKLAAIESDFLVKESIANGDARTQSMQIREFIEANVDAILVCAVDQNSIIEVLQEAKSKKIPVIAFDRELPHGEVVNAYVGPDSIADGELCAQAMIQYFEEKKEPVIVLELVGALNDQNGIDRSKGWNQLLEKEVLKDSNEPKFQVIQMPTDWDTQSATEAVQNVFQSVDNIQAVFCATDSFIPSVNSVLDKLKEQNILKEEHHIFINGINGSHDGYQAVKDGKADGFVVMDLETTGESAIELVDQLVSGKKVERVNKVKSSYYTQETVEDNKGKIWGEN